MGSSIARMHAWLFPVERRDAAEKFLIKMEIFRGNYAAMGIYYLVDSPEPYQVGNIMAEMAFSFMVFGRGGPSVFLR
ncbi:hypothetical protein JTE90_013306 [Oedothorax gibbosus]|uniref:Uncharacterized protein n=1 Tax=Oedothorax gibbosus TaxID=931172 RepID=A0AAV6VEX5_9ARAC|nr:hypothetical protein JTE90_013306 [Oedothorax gibbosus]